MVEHADEKHPGELDFSIESMCFPKSSLLKQATEAMEIESHRIKYMVINRKGEWGQNLPPQLTLEDTNDQVAVPVKKRRHARSAPQSEVPVCPSNSGANSSSQLKRRRLDKGQTFSHTDKQTQSTPKCKIDKLNAKQGGLGLGQSVISFIPVKNQINGANTYDPPNTHTQFGSITLDEGDIEPGINFLGS